MSFWSVEGRQEMDSWIIIAAAGYFAMCAHNITKDKYFFKDTSSRNPGFKNPTPMSLIHHFDGMRCPFHPLRWCKSNEISMNLEKGSDCASEAQGASSCGFGDESVSSFDGFDESNAHSSSYFPQELTRTENPSQEIENGVHHFEVENANGKSSCKPSMAKVGSFRGSMINKISIGSNNILFGHPVSSLESCLVSQIFMEWDKIKEQTISLLPSSSAPTITSSLATEEFCNSCLASDQNKKVMEVHGHTKLPRKIKLKTRRMVKGGKSGIPSKLSNGRYSHHFHGDNKRSLSLGISIGIIYSMIATKREVEKLRGLLKESENLVQDLQEEIEMNDAISVKELINAGNSFPSIEVNGLHPEHELKTFARYDCEKHDKNPKCKSTIEAELEAELERLELSIDNKRVPNVLQWNPEFTANAFYGESRGNNNSGGNSEGCSSTYTTGSSKYAVSPRDLSLRLHEVIQSRLEERVRELELALQNDLGMWNTDSPESSPAQISTPLAAQHMLLNSSEELEEPNDLGIWSEEDNSGDEMEKLLIRQIVERTKKGSPTLLNAHRELLSMNVHI